MERFQLNEIDRIIISSNKNYQFDLLLEKIKQYQKSNRVYVVGFTNAGKSTMMNQLIYHYSDIDQKITTSMLPSTTLKEIEVPITSELTLIDTPGILEEGSILDRVDPKLLKKILPKKEIRPTTYQVKTEQFFFLENIVRIDCKEETNLTFFVSNELTLERKYKDSEVMKDLEQHRISTKKNQDIVITGLGFIKVSKASTFLIYTLPGVKIYTRDSLI